MGPVNRTDHRLQAGGALSVDLAITFPFNQHSIGDVWLDGIAEIEYDDVGLTFGLNWGY